ncbi:MAG TPA: hypothetical protein VGM88_26540 [Kofleriaceae bacterium]
MRNILALSAALALALTGGVAAADRFHGGGGGRVTVHGGGRTTVVHGGGRVVVHGGGGYGGYHGGGYGHGPVVHTGWGGGRGYYGGHGYYGGGYARRPIYVGRPIIHERYFDYYHRPGLIVENYGPRDGYLWVAGDWSWNGAEWIWMPGHYEPDGAYSY